MVLFSIGLALTVLLAHSLAQLYDKQIWPCNPSVNATGTCTPNVGLATSTYMVDFTQLKSKPSDWTISNYATVPFGSKGAEFTIAKRYDAPQLWTDFYILFGRIETVMQVAPGVGVISSSVLMSDDLDEIDWELSGNNFNASTTGMGQNNYFGKGVTGSYDRGRFFDVTSPQSQFHTYAIDWTPTQVIWSVDGVTVRTLLEKDCGDNEHQFPQTPAKYQIGVWDAGDMGTNLGTVSWAGGYTDLSKAPFTMYVRSVKITNANPASAYNYTDQSGKWQSIQLIQGPGINESSNILPFTTSTKASTAVPPQSPSYLHSTGFKGASQVLTSSATSRATSASTGSINTTMRSASSSSASSSHTTSVSTTHLTSINTTQATSSSPFRPTSTMVAVTSIKYTTVQSTTGSVTTKNLVTPTASTNNHIHTASWHYWRQNGHWVRGWW